MNESECKFWWGFWFLEANYYIDDQIRTRVTVYGIFILSKLVNVPSPLLEKS